MNVTVLDLFTEPEVIDVDVADFRLELRGVRHKKAQSLAIVASDGVKLLWIEVDAVEETFPGNKLTTSGTHHEELSLHG